MLLTSEGPALLESPLLLSPSWPASGETPTGHLVRCNAESPIVLTIPGTGKGTDFKGSIAPVATEQWMARLRRTMTGVMGACKPTGICARHGVLALTFAIGYSPAHAASMSFTCEQEDMMTPGWTGPLSITYQDGQITVASDHLNFTVPATESERTGVVDGVEVTAKGISGAAEIMAAVPEAQVLLDCALASLQPEFKTDPDMLALAVPSCLSKTAIAAAPVAMLANITIGLLPNPDAGAPDFIIEISRLYLNGTPLKLDAFPRNCVVAAP